MEVEINCLCGQTNQTVRLAADNFPVDTVLDHSNAARHSTGILFTSYLPLARPPPYQERCREYKLSEEIFCLFCNKCSCHLFRHQRSTDEYKVASGVIQQSGDIIKVVEHEGVDETLDGGVVPFIPKVAERQSTTLNEGIDGRQMLATKADSTSARLQPLKEAHQLLAQCHCGGVQFFVTPPNAQSKKLFSRWPDVLVPYHSGSSENLENAKWWLRANKTKYLAGLCACRSCRLSAGFPIQAWAFIPKVNLLNEDKRPFNMESGCLRRFESSPGVYRDSCMTCGATLFWHSAERPDLIDVSVALLRAPSGARAETLLEWDTTRVNFVEEALDQEFARALQMGPRQGS